MLRRVLAVGVVCGLFLGLAPVAGAESHAGVAPETVSEELDGLPLLDDAPPADLPEKADAEQAQGGKRADEIEQAVGADSTVSKPVEAPMPFTMLGAELPEGAAIWARTSQDGHEWSEWAELGAPNKDEGPDEGSEEDRASGGTWRQMSEPLWVGEATWLQLTVDGASTEDVSVVLIDSMGLSRTLSERVRDAFASAWRGGAATAHAVGPPPIITRRQWGADESLRRGSPSYASDVDAVVVHHTAGSNSYTRDQAQGIVRGIYHYHTQTLGWNDIGYNMLVDRYGQIYEGRYGGLERPVIGAHAGGFNTGTFGISVLGNFESVAPTSGAFESVARAIAWKANLHNINPKGSVTLTSRGSTRYPSGTRVTLPAIFGHRDVTHTACPGAQFYIRLPRLRDRADTIASAGRTYPVTGDWNGDGRMTPGWFRNGRWYLRNSNSAGSPNLVFDYGRRGDVPVVGDWNANGQMTVGVLRGDTWYLSNRNGAGAPAATFKYGRRGDVPVVGDWNASGQMTVGVLRGDTWYLSNRNGAGAPAATFNYGWAGDVPVVGDWNGSGQMTVGVVRGATWYLSNRTSAGAPAYTFSYSG